MGPPNNRPGWDISGRLQELAAFSDAPNGLTRLYLGAAHRQAADVLVGWMHAAGMQARLDAIGNVVGRYEGETPMPRLSCLAPTWTQSTMPVVSTVP